jgi:hypothetical protein
MNIGSKNAFIINIGNNSSFINFKNNININNVPISTTHIIEGSNLYFSTNRTRSSFSINSISNGLSLDSVSGIFTLSNASTVNSGSLSSTDWNIFNNKINKNGDIMLDNLLFTTNKGIDTDTGSLKILSIGINNA